MPLLCELCSGRGHRLQSDLQSKQKRLSADVRRIVIAEPLNRHCGQLIKEALLNAFQHQISDINAPVLTGSHDPADGVAIRAI